MAVRERRSCVAVEIEIKLRLWRSSWQETLRGYCGACGGNWRRLDLAGAWSQSVSLILLHLAEIWLQ